MHFSKTAEGEKSGSQSNWGLIHSFIALLSVWTGLWEVGEKLGKVQKHKKGWDKGALGDTENWQKRGTHRLLIQMRGRITRTRWNLSGHDGQAQRLDVEEGQKKDDITKIKQETQTRKSKV